MFLNIKYVYKFSFYFYLSGMRNPWPQQQFSVNNHEWFRVVDTGYLSPNHFRTPSRPIFQRKPRKSPLESWQHRSKLHPKQHRGKCMNCFPGQGNRSFRCIQQVGMVNQMQKCIYPISKKKKYLSILLPSFGYTHNVNIRLYIDKLAPQCIQLCLLDWTKQRWRVCYWVRPSWWELLGWKLRQ